MGILHIIHSHSRWLVALISIIVLVKYLIGWIGNQKYSKLDQILNKIYLGFIDLQVTLGLIYLLWSGFSGAGFPRYRLEHGFMMIVALLIAHLIIKRWNSSPDSIRFRNQFLTILFVSIIIYFGVVSLPARLYLWTF